MADEDTVEEGDEKKAGKAGGKLKLIIMIIVGVLLVAGLSVGGTWFLLKDKLAEPETPGIDEISMEQPSMSAEQGEAIYHAMQPAFIVNYNVGGKSRYLQIELSVLTRDPAAVDVLILHNPLIRNNLLDVFSKQDVMALATVEGKEKLANDLTKAIQTILESEMGRPGIESVLYRSFIMQ